MTGSGDSSRQRRSRRGRTTGRGGSSRPSASGAASRAPGLGGLDWGQLAGCGGTMKRVRGNNMPKYMNGTLGSSEETKVKQQHFREIIRPHMRIVKGAINGKMKGIGDPQYLYIDMNAGCAWYPDGKGSYFTGSPVIAIEEASSEDIHFNAYFIESLSDSVFWLKKAVSKTNHKGFPTNVVNMDHRSCVVDWVIIGGCSGSTGHPAFQPEFRWVHRLTSEAYAADCKVYWKRNLKCRPTEYPGC